MTKIRIIELENHLVWSEILLHLKTGDNMNYQRNNVEIKTKTNIISLVFETKTKLIPEYVLINVPQIMNIFQIEM